MSSTILAFAFLAAGGGAPEVGAIRACWTDADEPATCIGVTVQDCIAAGPGGETTAGMSACILAESDAWEVLMGEELRAAMAFSRELDATAGEVAPDMTRAGTLEAAQTAWLAYRDAHCRAEYARWGDGTLRQIVGANCLMVETAERAIALRSTREP